MQGWYWWIVLVAFCWPLIHLAVFVARFGGLPPGGVGDGRLRGRAGMAGLKEEGLPTEVPVKQRHPGGPGYLAALDTAAARRSVQLP